MSRDIGNPRDQCWIPVSEQFPKTSMPVWVYGKHPWYKNPVIIPADYQSIFGRFSYEEGFTETEALYWMPRESRPLPPKMPESSERKVRVFENRADLVVGTMKVDLSNNQKLLKALLDLPARIDALSRRIEELELAVDVRSAALEPEVRLKLILAVLKKYGPVGLDENGNVVYVDDDGRTVLLRDKLGVSS